MKGTSHGKSRYQHSTIFRPQVKLVQKEPVSFPAIIFFVQKLRAVSIGKFFGLCIPNFLTQNYDCRKCYMFFKDLMVLWKKRLLKYNFYTVQN